jgi:hypothetical protein
MPMMLVAWPNGSWSVMYTLSNCELPHILDGIDASADPDIASIFVASTEGGEAYIDLPEGRECGIPLTHWGDLTPIQLRPPYDAMWKEWNDDICDLLGDDEPHSTEEE